MESKALKLLIKIARKNHWTCTHDNLEYGYPVYYFNKKLSLQSKPVCVFPVHFDAKNCADVNAHTLATMLEKNFEHVWNGTIESKFEANKLMRDFEKAAFGFSRQEAKYRINILKGLFLSYDELDKEIADIFDCNIEENRGEDSTHKYSCFERLYNVNKHTIDCEDDETEDVCWLTINYLKTNPDRENRVEEIYILGIDSIDWECM